MHELSIAHGVVDVAIAEARRIGGGRVVAVHVAVGRLSGVEAGALQFCYEIAAAGTPLDGSSLVIEDVPIPVFCIPCGQLQELPGVNRFRCPVCDTPSGDIRRGRELELMSLEIDSDAPPVPEPTRDLATAPH
jgi:hydrogenase nickel incorporation protein HypA/HybF